MKPVRNRPTSFGIWLLAFLLAVPLASCGTVTSAPTPVSSTQSWETPAVSVQAADLPGVDDDIRKHLLQTTSFGLLVSALPRIERDKLATVLTYRAMDSNIGSALVPHLNNLEKAGSSQALNLLAFADGPEEGDSFYYYLVQDRSPALVSPYLYADPARKELNAADPQVLRNAVNWAYSKYPASYKVLDVSSHGGGYQGIIADYRANHAFMSLADFGQSVRAGLKGRKLDVLNLLACLMGTVEVAYEFRDVASVMVASEDSIMGGEIMYYSTSIGRLAEAGRGTMPSAQALGHQLVMDANPEAERSGAYSLSALDLGYLPDLKRSLNVLANSLIAKISQFPAIREAYQETPHLVLDESGMSGHRDLMKFCTLLSQKVPDPGVREAALAVKRVLRQAIVIAKEKGYEAEVANGLSIYMPDPGESLDPAYTKTRFGQETSWFKFLQALQS